MDSKVFGKFIASTRKEKNMTQADLAQIIGVTDKAISRWERGIGISIGLLYWAGVDVIWLIWGMYCILGIFIGTMSR